jgi:hypothetical protein
LKAAHPTGLSPAFEDLSVVDVLDITAKSEAKQTRTKDAKLTPLHDWNVSNVEPVCSAMNPYVFVSPF